MLYTDELRTRIAQYEAEVQRFQELIVRAKALLLEEERPLVGHLSLPDKTDPALSSGYWHRKGSIAEAVGKLVPATGPFRYSDVANAIIDQFPDRDHISMGKLVNATLRRMVRKAELEHIARGVYRRPIPRNPLPEMEERP